MGDWINKKFRKNQAVKCIVAYPDGRVKTHYLVPSNNTVSIRGESFIVNPEIHKDCRYLSKGFPTYIFSIGVAEPLNLFNLSNNKPTPLMSSKDFDIAINSRVATEILNSVRPKLDPVMMIAFIGMGLIIGLAVVWYLLSRELESVMLLLREVREVLRALGGL